jgi:hypothetical protein
MKISRATTLVLLSLLVPGCGDEDAATIPVPGGATSPATPCPTWNPDAYLKASNPDTHDLFGYTVAASGDTVVVGTAYEASGTGDPADNGAAETGAAYVFRQTGGVWQQEAYLKASNTGPSDGFGISVSIGGETIVVGAMNEDSNGDPADESLPDSGAAYVFR